MSAIASSSPVCAVSAIDPTAGAMMHAVGERVDALLDAALGDADDPHAVLIGTGLHDEVVVERRQRVLARVGRVVDRRVVADEDQLDACERQAPVGLGPAAVVAGRHADDAAEGPEGREAVAGLEVAPLEVLEPRHGSYSSWPGQVHLAVVADDRPVALDEDRSCCSGGRRG